MTTTATPVRAIGVARVKETSGLARLPALDALRAVGALAVVATHVGFNTGASLVGFWGGFLARFDVGVAIFFSLSGFLLFRPFAFAAAVGGKRPREAKYLWRRGLRILPAYWVAVVAYLLLLPQTSPITTEVWVKHLTLTQVYWFGEFAEGFGHTWSLCTEVAFYIAMPLMARAVLLRRWRPVRAIALLAVLGLGVTTGWVIALQSGVIDNAPEGLWLPSFTGWFAAGMALAVAHVAMRTGSAPKVFRVLDDMAAAPLACWTIGAAALAIATTPVAGPRDLYPPSAGQFAAKLALYLVVAVMLLIPLAFGPRDRFKGVFESRPARWLGTVSYGLFLWHPIVVAFLYRPGGRAPFTGDAFSTFLIVAVGGILLGAASFYLVERPLQAIAMWRRKR